MNQEPDIWQQALKWHEETGRDECDWAAFTAWLEQSPEHRQAYDDAAWLEDQVARGRAVLRAATVAEPVAAPRRTGRWLAVAATVAAAAFAWSWLGSSRVAPSPEMYQAGNSDVRRVQLDDGSSIVLAPGSSLAIAGKDQDRVELSGSAYFDVPHDPSRTLVVAAAGYEIRDIGTRFEVVAAEDQIKVSVAEGSVAVDLPNGAGSAQVVAGQRVLFGGGRSAPEYASIGADDVGSWREGRLAFQDEPLSLIAQQIARHAGMRVTLDPGIADRRYTVFLPIGDGSGLVAQFCEFAGLVSTPDGDAVHLSAGGADR